MLSWVYTEHKTRNFQLSEPNSTAEKTKVNK